MDTKERTLVLLIGGLTDGAVAHRLGVSERTVERYVRSLMDGAGCRNRMQLGRHAALTGLPAYGPEPVPGPRVPDRETRRLLELMLADSGATAPRSLHLSRRSVERRIRDLMTAAGARSRVQLGWLVTRWGWL
ncbi:helix-turn-helix domain-containing protein [Catenulispora rubra]|uniref:helix-turn-helix domain-containing protein n=1 Tax=Catenulispora rubra TaxID=280293 RepID=UPI001892759F|nr:helix-turn-helix transcriptional regulator [Catenulispora rubra]